MKILPLPTRMALAVLMFLAANSLHAQTDGTWNVGNGTWSSTASWLSGTVAGGAGSVANFTNNVTTSVTVKVDTPVTVGTLNVGDTLAPAGAFVFSNTVAGLMTFDNGVSNASFHIVAGALGTTTLGGNGATIGIILNSSLDIANDSSFEGSIGGSSTGTATVTAGSSGTKTITNSGTGTGGITITDVISNGLGVVAIEQNSATSNLTLYSANTYTGNTTLTAGRLRIGNSALGTGTLILNGGTLSTQIATQARTITNATTLNGNITLGDVVDNAALTFNGTTTLTGNSSLKTNSAVNYGALITDGGNNYSLTKSGTGRLTLNSTGSTSYTGGTIINEGTILLGANDRLADTGAVTLNGGTFDLANRTETVGVVTLNSGTIAATGATTLGILTGSGFNVYEGAISARLAGASAVLTKSGTGTVTLSGSTSYGGGTVINQGRLLLSGSGKLAAAGAVTVGGGTFDLGTLSSTVGAVTISSGTIANGTLTGSSYSGTSGTVSAVLAGSGALTKDGTGTLVLSATNTYSGGTIINQGSLSLSGGRLADAGAVTVSGGTFDLGGDSDTVGAVTIGSGTIANGTLTGSSYSGTSGTVSAVLAGSGALTKDGTGTLVLSATNTYTGATTVNAGTLLVEGELAAGSAVSVITSGTLGGSGRINGTVTVGAGGVLAPGSSPGVLEVGGLILGNGSETVMEIGGIDRGLTFDGIDILTADSLTYDGTLTLNFTDATALDNLYDLFSFSGLSSGSFDSILLAGFYTGTLLNDGFGVWSGVDSTDTFRFTFTQSTGDLLISVPEPSTWALLIGGLTVLAVFRKRRMAE